MGDGQDAEVGPVAAHLPHPVGHHPQGVDVEPGVGLVEDGHLRLQHRHLEDLVALLLAAGEALVEVAVHERRVHLQSLHPLLHGHVGLDGAHVGSLAGLESLGQEVADRDAGDLLGVLEGQEQAGLGPHVGGPVGDVLALEADRPGDQGVLGAAQQHVGQRGLARPVGPHQGVDLAGSDRQVDPLEDLGAALGGRRPQSLDLEERRPGHGAILCPGHH